MEISITRLLVKQGVLLLENKFGLEDEKISHEKEKNFQKYIQKNFLMI